MRAIITGAGAGIGRATCIKLASAVSAKGGKLELVAADLAEAGLATLAEELAPHGATVVTVRADVADPEAPSSLVATAESEFGGLDLIVSNAGCAVVGPTIETTLADWDKVFAVNVRAAWLLASAGAPLLKSSRGSLIFIASISGTLVTPPFGPYSASKGALLVLMRQLAVELGPDGIRVNCVSPGLTETAQMAPALNAPGGRAHIEGGSPLGRMGQATDIANAVAFLASSEASFITGTEMVVDGGFSPALMANFGSKLSSVWQ